MKARDIIIILFACLLLYAVPGLSEVPRLVKSIPADGAVNVPISQGTIIFMFDRNMKMNSWTLMESAAHPFPPIFPIEEPWLDPLTFEFRIKPLKPNTTYAIQLNGKKRKGFLTAEDQSALPITTITFTTAANGSQLKESVVTSDKAKSDINLGSGGTEQKSLRGQNLAQISPGWRFKVTRSTGIDGAESYQTGEQAPIRFFQKLIFTEEALKVIDNTIQESVREIESAKLHSLDPDTGQMAEQELVPTGTRFRLSRTPYGTTLLDAKTGQEIWDMDMLATFAPPTIPRLWPQGALQVGQKWSYEGAELVNRIGLIDALGGRIDLKVDKIKPEPSTGIQIAEIRGRLRTKVDLEAVILDFDAKVEIDLPLSLKVPFMVKFDGQLSGSGALEDGTTQPIRYTIQADGTVLQVVQPSNEVLMAIGGRPIEASRQIDTKAAVKVPLGGGMDVSQTTTGSAEKGAPVYRYKLYEDTTEQAFTVLVPQGWQTEGGIMQIPPNQIRTVVDGCGKKLYFSIYDPAGQFYITYFPTEIFHTLAPGASIMGMAPGQVLNGMMQMPQVLSPTEYVNQMLFPSTRPDASNVEWGKRNSLTELANAWNRAFHPDDKIPPQVIAESIEVAYDRSGARYAELWTALITSVTAHTSTIWMPDFAVVAGGPMDSVEEVAPVLKAVITSFRMNPQWLANTIAQFEACTKDVARGQQEIRDLEQKISKRLKQVQKEIHQIDNDIVANRDATHASIQEVEHNILMGEDTYEDTTTGKRYLIDMGYERNFTDGETLIQTNDWSFEPPVGYRDMKNINISGD